MDLRQLRYFLAVAELGGFTRAAAATGRTQQALSKGIQALEEYLGARLFDRGARDVRLTAVGRLLMDHARTADDAVRRFESRLRELQTGAEGELRIGTGPTTAGSLVGPAVMTLRRSWPRIGVKVVGGILPELTPALLTHDLDVVVTLNTVAENEAEADPRLHREILMQDEYRVMAAANHPLAQLQGITAQQLLEHPWAFGHRLGAVDVAFRQTFIDAGLEPPRQDMESDSLEFLRALVRDCGYLSLLPTRLVHAELQTGQWQRLDAPGFSWNRPVVIYTRAGEPQSRPLQRLLQALRHAASDVKARGQ